ncbi:unnamed protein product [Owenia fusiformis]|uniref:Uncharacterized protein n=1 Tax=Owenia fusiformis TaxID=6347 RepID=A0A8S4N5A7_OWEFU|nr:unnamed protein product [Owenia fusiformis]
MESTRIIYLNKMKFVILFIACFILILRHETCTGVEAVVAPYVCKTPMGRSIDLSDICCLAIGAKCATGRCCRGTEGYCRCCEVNEEFGIITDACLPKNGESTCRMTRSTADDNCLMWLTRNWVDPIINIQKFCCDRMKTLNACTGENLVCHYTNTVPFCKCGPRLITTIRGKLDLETGSLYKYTPIEIVGSVGLLKGDSFNAAIQMLHENSKNKFCYSKPNRRRSKQWEWIDVSQKCCEIRGFTFKEGCCTKGSHPFCYDCADDRKRKIGRKATKNRCWLKVSKTLNFIDPNSEATLDEPVKNFASLCCHIFKFKICLSKERWPFCKEGEEEDFDDRPKSMGVTPIANYIDMQYDACCAQKSCKAQCCYLNRHPFCSCCPCSAAADRGDRLQSKSKFSSIKVTKADLIGVQKLKSNICKHREYVSNTKAIDLPNYVDLGIFCCSLRNCKACERSRVFPFCKCKTSVRPDVNTDDNSDDDGFAVTEGDTFAIGEDSDALQADIPREASCFVKVAPPATILEKTCTGRHCKNFDTIKEMFDSLMYYHFWCDMLNCNVCCLTGYNLPQPAYCCSGASMYI